MRASISFAAALVAAVSFAAEAEAEWGETQTYYPQMNGLGLGLLSQDYSNADIQCTVDGNCYDSLTINGNTLAQGQSASYGFNGLNGLAGLTGGSDDLSAYALGGLNLAGDIGGGLTLEQQLLLLNQSANVGLNSGINYSLNG